MKRGLLTALLLLCLTACGGNSNPQPNRAQPVLFAPVPVVFIGDSITYYWGPGQQGNSDAFIANANWVNAGVYGETSGQILSRFAQDVVAHHPAMVHILAGTNDVYPGWLLCGGVQNVDTCGNIQAMVAQAKTAGIQVILGTIPPWGPGDASNGFDPSPGRYTRIRQLNQWIEQYSAANGLTIVDYHALLASSGGNTYAAGLTQDGIHPSPAAYALMTPAARQAISDAQHK